MNCCHFLSLRLCVAGCALIASSAAWADEARFIPIPVHIDELPTMQITIHGRGIRPTVAWLPPFAANEGGIAGCSNVLSHTNANFSSGSYIAQAGFAEQEFAAASYTIPAADFPAKMDLAEFIFVTSNASVQTTTQYSVYFWNGPPNTGAEVIHYSSDNSGTELPPIVLGPGTAGVNVQVMIDPGDPDQIIFNDNGSHVISFGVRVDAHNNQTANPCFTAPPTSSNAFPCVDTSGRQVPAGNWLNGINCGSFGCPANGGWANFSTLPSFCRPSGDWVMRMTYSPVNCQVGVGGCCLPEGFCEVRLSADCNGTGFTYLGDGSDCNGASCTPHNGACCLPGGACEIRLISACVGAGTSYRGDGTTCATANCPQPTGACCFVSTGGCVNLTSTNCSGAGGIWHGSGTACATTICFPMGACCLPSGACSGPVSPENCTGQSGTFQGHNSSCASVNCPAPLGACCFSPTFCLDLNAADCASGGAVWRGMGTVCSSTDCAPHGACCLPDGSCVGDVSSATCFGQNGSYRGDSSTCGGVSCPQPQGACCLPSGACSGNVTSAVCSSQSGAYQGNGSTCGGVTCPQPIGACCIGQSCLNLSSADCSTAHGTWNGIGSACGVGVCLLSCKRGDANCDNSVNNFDVDPFVIGIVNVGVPQAPAAYLSGGGTQACWDLRSCWGDVNRDTMFNNFDIDPFVVCILNTPPPGAECP